MPPVTFSYAMDLPGTWFLEDDGVPGNNMSRLRDPEGNIVLIEHPTDAFTLLADGPGVNLVIDLTDALSAANFTVGNRANPAQPSPR